MSHLSFRTSKPCTWNVPRQPMSAAERYHRHGPIVPMEEPRASVWARLNPWRRG